MNYQYNNYDETNNNNDDDNNNSYYGYDDPPYQYGPADVEQFETGDNDDGYASYNAMNHEMTMMMLPGDNHYYNPSGGLAAAAAASAAVATGPHDYQDYYEEADEVVGGAAILYDPSSSGSSMMMPPYGTTNHDPYGQVVAQSQPPQLNPYIMNNNVMEDPSSSLLSSQGYYAQQQQQPQQQQQQQMDAWNMSGPGRVDSMMGMEPHNMMMMYPVAEQASTWAGTSNPAATTSRTTASAIRTVAANTKKGCYYFESDIVPELCYGQHAITALAYDPTYECMYLSTSTQSMSSTRYKTHRASLLLTYATTPVPPPMMMMMTMNDGEENNIIYSSVAGHPEASSSTLQAIYGSIYGISKVMTGTRGGSGVGGLRSATTNHYPPPHAYTPPYGGGELAENAAIPLHHHNHARHQQPGHMGITELLPLGDGYVASVSPSAVRIHTYGGLQLHDHDLQGMLSGTIHPYSGEGGATHISVGGLSMAAINNDASSSYADSNRQRHQKDYSSIHCLDLWQGLRPVYSRSFKDVTTDSAAMMAVTSMATSHERGSVVAGCTDGNIRVFDGSLRELATIRSHVGGVSSVAISPDGMLIATTGYSSKAKAGSEASCSALYAFPDPTVYIYDIRYLGRGGISHPFAGVKGAPRHVRFLPDVEGCASNRLLVASGKQGGGIQILTPFEPQNEKTTNFLLPPLEQGESISAISPYEEDSDELALGTSFGRALKYRMAGFKVGGSTKTKPGASFSPTTSGVSLRSGVLASTHSPKQEKLPIDIPPFLPQLPAISMDPTLLQGSPSLRNGTTEEMRSIFGAYIIVTDPKISSIGNTIQDSMATFGTIAGTPILEDKRRTVSRNLLNQATMGEKEFMCIVETSKLQVDLLANHNVISKRFKGKVKDPIPNPNKFLYCNKLSSMAYDDGFNGKRKQHRGARSNSAGSSGDINEIPTRYQLQVRPGFKASGAFDPSEYNDTGLFPGWDYEPTMPNAWISPVLLLFYFIPEMRTAALAAQFSDEKALGTKAYEKSLVPELGFLFDQMDCLSRYGLLYPSKDYRSFGQQPHSFRPRIGAWVPSNILTFLSTMPEAEQLQVLDGSPAAVDRPRRPESFYRFLAYQLDKELSAITTPAKNQEPKVKLMDSLSGVDFLSSNQFIESKSSPPTQSMTRALTLDLNYDIFPPGTEKQPIRFGELLQHSLCRETRLRAWNSKSRAYETIVQRKIATSLPQVLTLSCACAGRKDEDGLWAWRTDHGIEPWLPEIVEIELLPNGNVAVKEFHQAADGSGIVCSSFLGKTSFPEEVSKMVSDASSKQKYRYRLEAVLSFVTDSGDDDMEEDESSGHHVLHARMPVDYKRRILRSQADEARKTASKKSEHRSSEGDQAPNMVLSASLTAKDYEDRAESAEKLLASMEKAEKKNTLSSDWILYNGFKVSKTVIEDARAFHVTFKEPVLVIFQAVDEEGQPLRKITETNPPESNPKLLPASVMYPRSLSSVTSGSNKECLQQLHDGRPVAFDAEFVSVQEEESTLTESGQKLVLRETRHALGRISVIDCPTKQILVDDHVLPRERVVDFLTRFSGIVPEDLDPAKSSHRIISTRAAYLQLRYLMEKGCIFVGHGLKQDFGTVNLVVPPYQILDTVEIFHQPGMRYISLRFLANYVLGRDMQQDTHDSVEDARAAYELYGKALEWKKEGVWDQRLQELYSYGEKTSWKLGVEDVK